MVVADGSHSASHTVDIFLSNVLKALLSLSLGLLKQQIFDMIEAKPGTS